MSALTSITYEHLYSFSVVLIVFITNVHIYRYAKKNVFMSSLPYLNYEH